MSSLRQQRPVYSELTTKSYASDAVSFEWIVSRSTENRVGRANLLKGLLGGLSWQSFSAALTARLCSFGGVSFHPGAKKPKGSSTPVLKH